MFRNCIAYGFSLTFFLYCFPKSVPNPLTHNLVGHITTCGKVKALTTVKGFWSHNQDFTDNVWRVQVPPVALTCSHCMTSLQSCFCTHKACSLLCRYLACPAMPRKAAKFGGLGEKCAPSPKGWVVEHLVPSWWCCLGDGLVELCWKKSVEVALVLCFFSLLTLCSALCFCLKKWALPTTCCYSFLP